jgi:hypothetical protein
MNAQLLSSLALCLFMNVAYGQIPEGGFDNLTSSGGCSQPTGWNTVNGTTGALGLCTAESETNNPYSGFAALKITSEFFFFAAQVIPGIVSNGNIDIQSQGVTGGIPFTERPTAFKGWYRAEPENNDTYSMIAVLINENNGDTVGAAIFEDNTTVSNWTEFNVPVDYFTQDIPTLLQINLFASDPQNPQNGSTVYFDELDYESLTVGLQENDAANINVYPNPAVDDVFFNIGAYETARVNIYNVLGTSVLEQVVTQTQNSVSLLQLTHGAYIWQLTTRKGEAIKAGKLILTK